MMPPTEIAIVDMAASRPPAAHAIAAPCCPACGSFWITDGRYIAVPCSDDGDGSPNCGPYGGIDLYSCEACDWIGNHPRGPE
ncbi:MAG: hypothetical protein ACRDPA_09915 [Solirubrobacteraceae bacterium]